MPLKKIVAPETRLQPIPPFELRKFLESAGIKRTIAKYARSAVIFAQGDRGRRALRGADDLAPDGRRSAVGSVGAARDGRLSAHQHEQHRDAVACRAARD